jgi:hypothetical protein
MIEPVPGKIDRAALERIVQRAAELQTGDREIGEGLSPEEVLALGKEVGIPPGYLQQAMLEESSRIDPERGSGLLDRAIGPAVCQAQRVVRGTREEVEERIIGWIDENELFTIQRQQPGRISWEALRGMQVAFRKSAAALGSSKRPFMLSRAHTLTATITALEPGFSHVSLGADLRPSRNAVLGGLAGLSSAALAATAILLVMSPFWWVALAPLPIFAGAGIGVSRSYAPVAGRVQLGLERALDHLERGEVKPTHALPGSPAGIMGTVLSEVRKALRP